MLTHIITLTSIVNQTKHESLVESRPIHVLHEIGKIYFDFHTFFLLNTH